MEKKTLDVYNIIHSDIMDDLKKNSEDKVSLDIYQMCSLMATEGMCDSQIKTVWYYLKAICCALFQTVGLTIFMINGFSKSDISHFVKQILVIIIIGRLKY